MSRTCLGSSVSGSGLLVPEAGIAGSYFDIAAGGPAFEELLQAFSDIEVQPGPFELTGGIAFRSDAIRLSKIALDRESGDARLDLTIGLGQATHGPPAAPDGLRVDDQLDALKVGFAADGKMVAKGVAFVVLRGVVPILAQQVEYDNCFKGRMSSVSIAI